MKPVKHMLPILTRHTALIVISLIVAAPLLVAILGSTQSMEELYAYPPKFVPGSAMIDNYTRAWNAGLGRMMLNSLFVTFCVAGGKILVAIFAALGIVYFDFRYKNALFFFILVTIMFPVPVRVVPLYDLIQNLKMGDTYYALIIPFLASATCVFFFRQHFMSIPSSYVDVARVEGAGPLKFLFMVLIPMTKNSIAALAVVEFIFVWNQYLWPMIVISSNERQVVQLGIKMLMQDTAGSLDWGLAMAGTVMALVPPLIVFLVLQSRSLRGFAMREEK